MRHYDQGNLQQSLLGILQFRGWEARQQAGRYGARAVAGNLYLDPQGGGREN